jgi:hypothetical protein
MTTTVTGNTITLDMTQDYLPIDAGKPWPKQVHLLLSASSIPALASTTSG